MKTCFPLVSSFLALAGAPHLQAQCTTFTQEHVDLLSIHYDATDNLLSLLASDDDQGTLYASNQCVVLCPESMKFTLQAGTPLGEEGAPMWILPQSPYEGVPYLGVSGEALAPGSFQDPMGIELLRVEGPGEFLLWQSTSFGDFDIRMDSRDGIDNSDRITPEVGAHGHYNWGFTTSGVYRVYFQASGRRTGQSTNLLSPETPFTFHVLPLRPFEIWTATNWPCETATNIIAAGADPDGDRAANAFEYGVGSDPKSTDSNDRPAFSLVSTNGQTYGAVAFNRSKAAVDAIFDVVANRSLTPANWQTLTNLHSIVDQGDTERWTVRDVLPVGSTNAGFYQLRVGVEQ